MLGPDKRNTSRMLQLRLGNEMLHLTTTFHASRLGCFSKMQLQNIFEEVCIDVRMFCTLYVIVSAEAELAFSIDREPVMGITELKINGVVTRYFLFLSNE